MAAAVEAATRSGDPAAEASVLRAYGFAVPTAAALDEIVRRSPGGVIEVGAGTGYWAACVADRGVDVVAVDLHPPPDPSNRWFAGVEPWFPVGRGDEQAVVEHAGRSLLLVWPTRDETWAADALALHHGAGGRCVLYVGQPPGGRTGDAAFHALTGATDRCIACTYGVVDTACTCSLRALWRCTAVVPLPRWQADDVALHVLDRVDTGSRGWRRRRR